MKVEIIETSRLFLRRFKKRDAKPMFKNWCGDPEVTKYMLWQTNTHVKQTKGFIKNVIKNYKFNPYHWLIINKSTKQPIGSIGVSKIYYQEKKCEAGYCLSKKYWNKGIMSEAFSVVIDFLFTEGFNEITAYHDINNPNSGKVMNKCGMQFVNASSVFNKKNNEYITVHNYSITAIKH